MLQFGKEIREADERKSRMHAPEGESGLRDKFLAALQSKMQKQAIID